MLALDLTDAIQLHDAFQPDVDMQWRFGYCPGAAFRMPDLREHRIPNSEFRTQKT